ncbi:MAG: GGDEF domain-containing protein [Oscillospiraceae bacterium]|nr:GGDEF domain-containing protein [Oscillospiraceae bacterium]MBR5722036.1 GGDEF domain-containing protein [Oscillospiraceae bacterium]
MKLGKKQLIYSVVVAFAFFTVYLIIYAFYHRDKDELVYLIFNTYALIAVLLSFLIVLYRERKQRRKKETDHKRLIYMAENLSAPAMLWSNNFSEIILNEALSELSGITVRPDFDAKYIVSRFFGKKDMTDDDIRALVLAKHQEFPVTTASGEKRTLIWNTCAVETDEDGVTWLLSIGMDVTDIRTMQSEIEAYSKALSVSRGQHNLTMELLEVGILMIEQGNTQMFPSEKLQSMLGITEQDFTVQGLREHVYPLDAVVYDRYVETMRSHMAEFINKTDSLELRLCAADGEYRWYSYRFKVTENPATGRLVAGGSVIDVTQEKAKDARIEQIAYEDAVTGIPNRNRLMLVGHDLYAATSELHTKYWVIVMDIDRFHLINDTCGYAVGNDLLKDFAKAVVKQLSFGGFAARISGDNFALILRDTGDDTLPEKAVKRVQRKLNQMAVGALAGRALTCSAGFARMPADGESFENVMEHAEFALSSASNIHGSISRYTSQMHDTIIEESNLEAQLTEGIMRNELTLFYQPKVSLETGEVMGLEALIRWQHPSGRLLPPGVFIPIAERSQLITHVTRFVLNEACRQAKLWQTMKLKPVVMSINFTSTDFYTENICGLIISALKRNELDPRWLEIELTESLALKDIDTTIARMQELRDAGIQLAMDDFGTGYSSLSYIQRLPFTMLKLDRAFVMHMDEDPVVQEIVRSVARIAKAKQIRTIAEGVETPEQAEQLRAAGCNYAQGYLYGQPMTAKETEQYIRRNMEEMKKRSAET